MGILQNNLEKIYRFKFRYIIIAFVLSLFMLEFDWYISSMNSGATIGGVYAQYNSLPVMIMSMSGDNTITIYYLNWILGYTIMPKIIEFLVVQCHFNYSIWFNLVRSVSITIICGYFGKMLKYIPIINKIEK